jgi:hypothetical protein
MIKEHIKTIREPDFTAVSYDQKGYVLRGGILTDGHRLNVEAYKIKELQSARYKRLSPEKLPERLTSTVAGTSDYLTEIRNVIKSKEDVTRIWNCNPNDIKIVGLDLGQAYVVGVNALLPDDSSSTSAGAPQVATSETTSVSRHTNQVYHNLAVSQKAVYQPVFRFRRWLNDRKRAVAANPDEENQHTSVLDIESHMPSLRGENADFQSHVEYVDGHQQQLQACYDITFKKHKWDQQRAKDEEFAAITNQILGLVGGSIGRPRKKDDAQGPGENVLFVIGLGDFKSNRNLTSLHGSFCSYFVNKVSYPFEGVKECTIADHSNNTSCCHRFAPWDT